MARNKWWYHPDNYPDGQIFDMEEMSEEVLRASGAVTSPAHFGHDPLGKASPAYLAEEKAKHHAEVAAGGPAPMVSAEEQQARLTQQEREIAELQKQLRLRDEELDGLQTRLTAEQERAQALEKAQDETSDALKGGRGAAKDAAAAQEGAEAAKAPEAKPKAPARKRPARTAKAPEA